MNESNGINTNERMTFSLIKSEHLFCFLPPFRFHRLFHQFQVDIVFVI